MSKRAQRAGERVGGGADFSDLGGGTSLGKKFCRSEGPNPALRAWGTRKRNLGDLEGKNDFLDDLERERKIFSPKSLILKSWGTKKDICKILTKKRYQ